MTVHPAETITLPQPLRDAMVAHAREGKPEEICGIVRGRGTHALELIRARNIAEERVENYTVDPQTLLRQFEFEDAGDEMMGIYHSHPDSVAEPSATDAWNAHYPDAVYFICSLEHDEAPVIRAWRLVDADVALDWNALRRALPFVEVRRGLWGYFQAAGAPLPAVLAATPAAGQRAPWYLVFATDTEGALLEGRFVIVRECAVMGEAPAAREGMGAQADACT